jgi:hypothetical protein
MDRTPVVSSNVASVGYDSATSTLEVEFQGGSLYRYTPVQDADYRALVSGELSAGKFVGALRHMPVTTVRVCPNCDTDLESKAFRDHACAVQAPVAEVA